MKVDGFDVVWVVEEVELDEVAVVLVVDALAVEAVEDVLVVVVEQCRQQNLSGLVCPNATDVARSPMTMTASMAV